MTDQDKLNDELLAVNAVTIGASALLINQLNKKKKEKKK